MASRYLLVNMNIAIKNPSNKQLLNMINLIGLNHESMPVVVRYTDIENCQPLITDRIAGRIPNMHILDDLCINGFYDREIIRKQLK